MKSTTTLVALFLMGAMSFAQKNVTINLIPYFGGQPMTLNQNYVNNSGKTTQMSRGTYYLCDIKLIHDGAQILDLSQDEYLLVHANTQAYSIGSHSVTNIEGIEFSVGVDNQPNNNPNDPSSNTTNHADPSLWPNGHPLNLQSPSMHWGWASGYMFAFMAGSVDTDNDNVVDTYFEIAPLGDQYFTNVSVTVNGVNNGNDVDINVYVNYSAWLDEIKLDLVGISHGSGAPCTALMNNTVPENVFTASAPVGVQEFNLSDDIHVYPNPVVDVAAIKYNLEAFENLSFEVYEISGKLVYQENNLNPTGSIEFTPSSSGSYVYNFLSDGKVIHTDKLVKQ